MADFNRQEHNSDLAGIGHGMFASFRFHGVILTPERLRYSPHPDIIHPSVMETGCFHEKALARYYLYYAPHDAPGGICLACADELEGPWHEYERNPIIAADWPPHHRVSHVSSPHAVWNSEEQHLFLYYHGENDTTRLAVSTDGVHFEYNGSVVDTTMFEAGLTEASYARVFRHTTASAQGPYFMFIMGNCKGSRNIYRAWSPDGRRWETDPSPFITPPAGTNQMGPGSLFEWKGEPYLVCFANQEDSPEYSPISDLYLYRVTPQLDQSFYLGRLMGHDEAGDGNARVSDPFLLRTSEHLYLFMSVGSRLNQKIALAVATLKQA